MLPLLKRKPVSPCRFLQIIGEQTAPNFFWSDDTRLENRNNRTIPVTVSPWTKNKPADSPMRVAMTRDISQNGACLITTFDIAATEMVLGIYVKQVVDNEALFFLGTRTLIRPIAEGYWQVGLKITELLNPNFPRQMKTMIPKAMQLLTPPEATC